MPVWKATSVMTAPALLRRRPPRGNPVRLGYDTRFPRARALFEPGWLPFDQFQVWVLCAAQVMLVTVHPGS